MKWLNPGFTTLFSLFTGTNSYFTTINDSTSQTGKAIESSSASPWKGFLRTNIDSTDEGWVSFDIANISRNGASNTDNTSFSVDFLLNEKIVMRVAYHLYHEYFEVLDTDNTILYKYDDPSIGSSYTNIEVHFKTGENGRIDVWKSTKLLFSYRTPSAFSGNINAFQITLSGFNRAKVSSIIYQDTRRIGLEKFKKLTINPDTEQNMPQGSTTTYTLSGLSDATEFSDITSVCAVLQATSRDANISTGTFSLEGADVGTIDVSDSSGKAYEIAHAETNSLTGKPWTRDDIEGKTLSFKVNGAS